MYAYRKPSIFIKKALRTNIEIAALFSTLSGKPITYVFRQIDNKNRPVDVRIGYKVNHV